jgi:hypothetical protein
MLFPRPRTAPSTANSCGGSDLLVEHATDRPDKPGQFTRNLRHCVHRPFHID